ncbi:hypothetical protein [Alteromonas sp. CYL-A6]|uniref:hypothetical protein n=1 Tax=Alteromonas nitratireducens TaxID=3390813 RepID=UPI0034B07ABD
MMFFTRNARIAGVCALALGLTAMGCSLSDVRKVTYPPDFNYIEPTSIKSDMAKMAAQIRLLDIALQSPAGSDEDAQALQQKEVMAALNSIGKIASSLQSKSGSNHPYMDDFMGDFVATVDQARTAASLAEPRYYFAGKVSGACAACHQVNRD